MLPIRNILCKNIDLEELHVQEKKFLRAGRKQVSLHFQEGQKSQNAVDRDLWRSSGLTVLLKHGHLQQVAQDLAFLVIYKEGDSITSLGNL